jgi:TolB-like protein
MFTDIVGYTSLMGSDEDKAFQFLRQNRDIQQSLINKFHGEWLKEIGDGILAQFSSATDSVQCAIDIQKHARKELDARIRIGIHLGDVTFENKDVFGDGVNISSRLQSIADPGGIYISESIHNAIRSQKDIDSQYLGEVTLKNVNYPFKTYYIKGRGLPIPSKDRIDELTRAQKIESVVVLPFDNYTGSDELEYFVSGMHSSMIGAIGRISSMRVISKTTSNVYKDTEKSIPEIASELGVNAVIEASVLSLGEKICLQIKLMDAYPEEKQLWMQDYVEDKSQILNLYNTVTKEISKEIDVLLTPEEERILAKSRTIDREVYDSYLKGFSCMEDFSKEAVYKAMEYLNSAIKKDPDWAPLYAGLAKIWIVIATFGYESHSDAYQNVYDNLDKALELDPNVSDAHHIRAMSAYLNEWKWDESEKDFIKALAINPNDVTSRIYYSHLLSILHRFDEALTQGQLALDLDPLNPQIQGLYAALYQCVGDHKTAMTYYENILADDPEHALANDNIIIAAYQCGAYEREWKELKFNLIQKHIVEKDEINKIDEIYNSQGFIAAIEAIVHHLEGLAKSGYGYPLNLIDPAMIAYYFYMVNQDDKAIKWLEEGYEMHHPIMPYAFTRIWGFSRLYENPRFIEIVRKMNLPLP